MKMARDISQTALVRKAVEYLNKLISVHQFKEPPPLELSAIEGFDQFCVDVGKLKEVLYTFSKGDFSFNVDLPGASGGYIKTLQANLRHLAWQCRTVAAGDLTQQVDFMGELSEAFNSMTASLTSQHETIQMKQKQLLHLTSELTAEIKKKEEMEAALRASEEMYRQKSLHDSLTGLYNRGYFFETASREMENLKRQAERSSCILMMDIDNFKRFNDEYGHLCGDEAIKMVGAVISNTLRKSDIFARYGGEEFVLLLIGASQPVGISIAERIRGLVESQVNPSGATTPVTISIGVFCVHSDELNPTHSGERILEAALSKADEALYKAKEKGRNMVWLYGRDENAA